VELFLKQPNKIKNMSGYSNFGKSTGVKEGSGYALASQYIAQGLASAGKAIAGARIQRQKVQVAKQDRYDLTWASISENENNAVGAARQKLIELNASTEITDLLQGEQKDLMNGIGEIGDANYTMGSIEAKTLIRTESGASKQDKEKWQEIVNKADKNLQDTLTFGGVLMNEREEIMALKGSVGPGKEKSWLGNSFLEKMSSSFTSFRMNKQIVPGVDTKVTKDKNSGGLLFTHTVDANSGLLADIKEGGETAWDKANVKKVGDKYVITQTLDKDFNGDLLRDVAQAADYKAEGVKSDIGVVDSKEASGIIPSLTIRLNNTSTDIIDANGKTIDRAFDTRVDYIDMPQLVSKYDGFLTRKVESIYQLDTQAKLDYFANRRDISLPVDFTTKTPDQQRSYIREEEKRALIKEISSGWVERKLTDAELINLEADGRGVPQKFVTGSNIELTEEYKEFKDGNHYFSEKQGAEYDTGEGTVKGAAKWEQMQINNIYNPKNKTETPVIYARKGNTSMPTRGIEYFAAQPATEGNGKPEFLANKDRNPDYRPGTEAKLAGWYPIIQKSLSNTQNLGGGFQQSSSEKRFVIDTAALKKLEGGNPFPTAKSARNFLDYPTKR
tara:strand:+ start:7502 stop:9343 length:1842 start_codon:yes stop_codon:yes gene_type:complete